MEYSEKQLQIIEAAERLFATKGYEGTSVRDIAQEANVNLAMISYYFGSKEKLMEALFDCRGGFIQLTIQNMLDNKELTPLQKIYGLIDAYMEKMFTQQYFHKIMAREQMSKYLSDNTLATMILEAKKKNQEVVRQIIQEGQKKGVFKKNIDIPFMLMTLFGTANHLITTQHFYREVNDLKDMPDEDFQKLIKKKLSHHLKTLFKAILTYEA
ncbi:TetR family transcriptional regulator [Chitinophagaceae bacterium MMS25-I14]